MTRVSYTHMSYNPWVSFSLPPTGCCVVWSNATLAAIGDQWCLATIIWFTHVLPTGPIGLWGMVFISDLYWNFVKIYLLRDDRSLIEGVDTCRSCTSLASCWSICTRKISDTMTPQLSRCSTQSVHYLRKGLPSGSLKDVPQRVGNQIPIWVDAVFGTCNDHLEPMS